jgi:hypothetical protein
MLQLFEDNRDEVSTEAAEMPTTDMSVLNGHYGMLGVIKIAMFHLMKRPQSLQQRTHGTKNDRPETQQISDEIGATELTRHDDNSSQGLTRSKKAV